MLSMSYLRFVLCIIFSELPINFIVLGFCYSSLYRYFVLNANLLLILLMQMLLGGFAGNVSYFSVMY